MLEEAIPISVSGARTQTASEVYTVKKNEMHTKEELTKEEKHKERAAKKRKIKSHLKAKETEKKEKRREDGMAQVDRFEAKQAQKTKALKKLKERERQAEGIVEVQENPKAKGTMKSTKFFKAMNQIAKADEVRKTEKIENKGIILHQHANAKKFKT